MILPLLAAAAVTAAPADYRDDAAWLCRPGRADACVPDAEAHGGCERGTATTEAVVPARAPVADCFYVYPTASNDPGDNSDMVPGVEEKGQAASQFAAFAQVCRTFAPVYRQVTLTALHKGAAALAAADWGLAYRDVRAAFTDYLARDNGGPPVRADRPQPGVVAAQAAGGRGDRRQAARAPDAVGDPAGDDGAGPGGQGRRRRFPRAAAVPRSRPDGVHRDMGELPRRRPGERAVRPVGRRGR